MKLEILKNLPAVFDNMSLLNSKNKLYFAKTLGRAETIDSNDKLIYLNALKDRPGIYMITNKITKKIYIGMTKDLKSRFENYLNTNRLMMNRSSRIHKAILKYKHQNFSVAILEFVDKKEKNTSGILRKREDYYIRVFKPQYNIARSSFNIDIKLKDLDFSVKKKQIIPLKVKNLLDKCLDPKSLD